MKFELLNPAVITVTYARKISTVLCLLCLCLLGGQTKASTILVLGDSLSAAYGIPYSAGWAQQLQVKLKARFDLVNASISGETTDGGLRALPKLLEQHQPSFVIIELGANDGLRGFPLSVIEQNLMRMVTLSKDAGAEVLLIGNHIPPNYGPAYANAFFEIFARVARRTDSALVPFMLEGVATRPELMQDDGLHPKAEAQSIILDTVWRKLETILNSVDVEASSDQ